MDSKIKSFEDACTALGIEAVTPDVSKLPIKHQKAVTANYKLVIIAEALNEGWQSDWNNFDERKYYPWFDMETYGDAPKGSGLVYYDVGDFFTGCYASSRLCYKSTEIAKYAATQFVDLYKDCYTFN